MIQAFAVLLICQLAGETAMRALALPLPGPVAGMGLLFAWLLWRPRRSGSTNELPEALGAAADGLLRNLSLLFVPAAVGVIQHFDLLRAQALPILAAVVGSTLLTIAVSAWVFQFAARKGAPP
jgi:holin-like protein